jgi:putative metalloprotease
MNKFSIHATTGLLKNLKDKDELAGVLAHEIGHIKLGHYDEHLKKETWYGFSFTRLWEKRNSAVLTLWGRNGTCGSRVQQGTGDSADDYGVVLAARPGMTVGLYNAFQSMLKAGFKTAPSGFNSHLRQSAG